MGGSQLFASHWGRFFSELQVKFFRLNNFTKKVLKKKHVSDCVAKKLVCNATAD